MTRSNNSFFGYISKEIYLGIDQNLKGLQHTICHPVDSVKNIAFAVSHPVQTVKVIGSEARKHPIRFLTNIGCSYLTGTALSQATQVASATLSSWNVQQTIEATFFSVTQNTTTLASATSTILETASQAVVGAADMCTKTGCGVQQTFSFGGSQVAMTINSAVGATEKEEGDAPTILIS